MAMIKCPECKESISSKAVFCPHCGCPIAENPLEPTYDLKKGSTSTSGLATFLTVLAWITWIGGLIIAIAGANVTVGSYYPRSEFSFVTFITLLIPFVIYGALLFAMSTLVQRITDTYFMVEGLTLIRRNAPALYDLTAQSSGTDESAPQASGKEEDNSDWIVDEDPNFIRCPACGSRASRDFMKYRSACNKCGHEYKK